MAIGAESLMGTPDANRPKPKGLGTEYASQFRDPSVAAAYHHRPPYPETLFPLLADLVVGNPRTVLDVGCGTGYVTRPLVSHVDRVDAVDISAPMLAVAGRMPDGNHPNIRWIHGLVEEVELDPPYGLITAGASLHWMEWSIVLPRFRRLLAPGGVLALVERSPVGEEPWRQELRQLLGRYSTNRDFRPTNTVDELTTRGLFAALGEVRTEPIATSQNLAGFVESFHARNGFSRDRMEPQAAVAFDKAVTDLLAPYTKNGKVHWQDQGVLVWGEPDPDR
jgi:ubiquinone/menaquinone biosynthesis C-methylase UbiE